VPLPAMLVGFGAQNKAERVFGFRNKAPLPTFLHNSCTQHGPPLI